MAKDGIMNLPIIIWAEKEQNKNIITQNPPFY
jgi:hypothetical protein